MGLFEAVRVRHCKDRKAQTRKARVLTKNPDQKAQGVAQTVTTTARWLQPWLGLLGHCKMDRTFYPLFVAVRSFLFCGNARSLKSRPEWRWDNSEDSRMCNDPAIPAKAAITFNHGICARNFRVPLQCRTRGSRFGLWRRGMGASLWEGSRAMCRRRFVQETYEREGGGMRPSGRHSAPWIQIADWALRQNSGFAIKVRRKCHDFDIFISHNEQLSDKDVLYGSVPFILNGINKAAWWRVLAPSGSGIGLV